MADLIVENGTGLPTANTFASRAFFVLHSQTRGRCLDDFVNVEIDAALTRASAYLSESFYWQGYRVHGRNDDAGYQALAWPRYGVYDREGDYVADNSIPREIALATCELAHHELLNPESLQPVYTPHDRYKRLKAGRVEIEFDIGRSDALGARPILLIVQDLLGEFINASAGNLRSGRAARI